MMAMINHLGTLTHGHYIAIVRDRGKSSWLHYCKEVSSIVEIR